MEIVVAGDRAVHSLFMCSKKNSRSQDLCTFFEQMNNLRTVTRLGVDKFTSSSVVANTIVAACELANTLRLGTEEEEYYLPSLFGGGVTFLLWRKGCHFYFGLTILFRNVYPERGSKVGSG